MSLGGDGRLIPGASIPGRSHVPDGAGRSSWYEVSDAANPHDQT